MLNHPMTQCTLAATVALCLAAPFAAAQDAEVQPPSRTLLLSTGKSAVVKIDTGDCKPTWTAASANEAVATVSPATAGAGNRRSFKITAPKGQFSASTAVDITLEGMGANCDQTQVVTIQVFVVMDANAPKHYASGDKNTGIVGTKKRLKDLKKTGAGISRQLKKDLKTIVKQLKTDTLPAQEGPGSFPPPLWALRLATDCADEALDLLEDAFEAYIEELAGDGYNLMSLYGFLDFLDEFIASEFQTGSCGLWDGAVHDGSELVNGLTYDFDQVLKKTASQLEWVSAWSPTPMTVNSGTTSTEFPLSTGGLDPTTTGKFDNKKGKTLKIRKVQSSNYVDANGCSNHGRIKMKGKALASDGPVTITYERLDSNGNPVGMGASDFFEETGVTPNAKCKFKGRAPGDPTLANLNAGRWRVTVTQGSGDSEKSATQFHTISTTP